MYCHSLSVEYIMCLVRLSKWILQIIDEGTCRYIFDLWNLFLLITSMYFIYLIIYNQGFWGLKSAILQMVSNETMAGILFRGDLGFHPDPTLRLTYYSQQERSKVPFNRTDRGRPKPLLNLSEAASPCCLIRIRLRQGTCIKCEWYFSPE